MAENLEKEKEKEKQQAERTKVVSTRQQKSPKRENND